MIEIIKCALAAGLLGEREMKTKKNKIMIFEEMLE